MHALLFIIIAKRRKLHCGLGICRKGRIEGEGEFLS